MEHTFVIKLLGLQMPWFVILAELDFVTVVSTVLRCNAIIQVTANIYIVRHAFVILVLSNYFPRAKKEQQFKN